MTLGRRWAAWGALTGTPDHVAPLPGGELQTATEYIAVVVSHPPRGHLLW